MSAKPDKPMNVRQAAQALGVHENTLRNWEKRGLLRAIRLPSGVRRFSRDDVERMRREMWEQFAPATELPTVAHKLTKRGSVIDGDVLPEEAA